MKMVFFQSLILVQEPYYNEPGFELNEDKAKATVYKRNLWPATVEWAMIDMLQHPPAV